MGLRNICIVSVAEGGLQSLINVEVMAFFEFRIFLLQALKFQVNVNNYPGGSTSVKKYTCAFELGDLTFPNGYDCITFYTLNTSL